MSEKFLLELYDRVASLESKVAELEKTISEQVNNVGSIEKPIKEIKGRYRYLADYLLNSNKDKVDLSFAEIEEIIQSKLPKSARNHRALWANAESHSIALAWMNVGYKTTSVNMKGEKIRFERR